MGNQRIWGTQSSDKRIIQEIPTHGTCQQHADVWCETGALVSTSLIWWTGPRAWEHEATGGYFCHLDLAWLYRTLQDFTSVQLISVDLKLAVVKLRNCLDPWLRNQQRRSLSLWLPTCRPRTFPVGGVWGPGQELDWLGLNKCLKGLN